MPAAPRRDPVSATVITLNESRNLRACLESLRWVDDLVVVDAGSDDDTVEIARAFTERVVQRDWPGFAAQKNYACSLAKHDWVLSVDADERVSPALRAEIEAVLRSAEPRPAGYRVPRETWYLGRWIRHSGWYPDESVRLFRRSLGAFGGGELHERVRLQGPTGRLRSPLLHFNYPDVAAQLATVDRYSTIRSRDLWASGARFSLARLLLRPPLKLLEVYVWKRGFLDGLPGVVIAVMSALAVFLRYAKLWELEREGERPPSGGEGGTEK